MICAGIDAGSRTVKVLLFDTENKCVCGRGISDQGIHQKKIAEQILKKTCEENNISHSNLGAIVVTGYGRSAFEGEFKTITEITCHARGVHFQEPDARTIIDIGGQDSKTMRLGDKGNVRDFSMNDRCAAGTGRFFEAVARQLGCPMEKLGEMAARADKPSAISSMCVVFAETEIIGLLASGESPENIVAGVQRSISSRIQSMAQRRIAPPVIFTGGVALIEGMDRAIKEATGHPVTIAKFPQYTGALGAAILASE